MKVVCNSNEDIIKNKLTYGKEYNCIETTSLGDFLIENDDNSDMKYYKNEFFSIINTDELNFMSYKKVW